MKANKKLSLPVLLVIIAALVTALTCGLAVATESAQGAADEAWEGLVATAGDEIGDEASDSSADPAAASGDEADSPEKADAASGDEADSAAGAADGSEEPAADDDSDAAAGEDGEAAESDADEAAEPADDQAGEADGGDEAADEKDESVELMADSDYQTVRLNMYVDSSGVEGSYPITVIVALMDYESGIYSQVFKPVGHDGQITITLPDKFDVSDTSKVFQIGIGALNPENGDFDDSWSLYLTRGFSSTYITHPVRFNENGQLMDAYAPSTKPLYPYLVKTGDGADISGGASGSGYTGSGSDSADPVPEPEPELRTVTATKVWDDDDNASGARADVTLHLQSKVGDEDYADVPDSETMTIPASASGDALTVAWEDVPATTEDGVEIQYMVVEDEIAGYTTKVTGDYEDGFTVTNTLNSGEDSGGASGDDSSDDSGDDSSDISGGSSSDASGESPSGAGNSNNPPPDDPDAGNASKTKVKSKLAKTGDAGMLALCGTVALLAAGAAVTTAANRRRSRKDDEK